MSKQKYPHAATVTVDGTVHKGREHYSHAKADAFKHKRRDEAEDRQIKYDVLTLKEKLATCVPGGSKRQRARLEAAMAKEVLKTPAKVVTAPVTTAAVSEKKKRTPKSKIVEMAKSERPSKS